MPSISGNALAQGQCALMFTHVFPRGRQSSRIARRMEPCPVIKRDRCVVFVGNVEDQLFKSGGVSPVHHVSHQGQADTALPHLRRHPHSKKASGSASVSPLRASHKPNIPSFQNRDKSDSTGRQTPAPDFFRKCFLFGKCPRKGVGRIRQGPKPDRTIFLPVFFSELFDLHVLLPDMAHVIAPFFQMVHVIHHVDP